MNPRAHREYWVGQYDALMHCAAVLDKLADNRHSTTTRRLAAAVRTKAVLIGRRKLFIEDDSNGQHESTRVSREATESDT